jgi:uncharacterized protein YuzE
MEKIKVIHDKTGHTLTVWLGNPQEELICEETTDEVVLMKDKNGKVIGVEFLNYIQEFEPSGMAVETILRTGTE